MGEYHALVYSLHASACKIVPANEMLVLKPDFKAVRLNPKSEKAFSKTTEYGRIEVLGGEKKLVRYFIFVLSKDLDALKSLYSNDKGRFVPPKRLTITSATVEDLNTYKYPDERKDCLQERKTSKKVKNLAQKSGSDGILEKFKLKNKCVPIPIPTTATQQTTEQQIKNEEGISNDDALAQEKGSNQDKFIVGLDVMKPSSSSQLPIQFPSLNASGPSFQYSSCNNMKHLQLQFDLDEALTKLENSYLEIKRLRAVDKEKQTNSDLQGAMKKFHDKQSEMLATVQADVQSMKEILKRLERVEVANSATFQSQLCELESNLVSSDDEDTEVEKAKFQVDHHHLIDKQAVINIEADKNKFFCHRLERLCDLICKGEVAKYSMSGWSNQGKGLIKITDRTVKSIIKLLTAMQWPHPQEIREDKVRSRISKYCSAARKEDDDKAKVLAKKLADQAAATNKRKTGELVPGQKKRKSEEAGNPDHGLADCDDDPVDSSGGSDVEDLNTSIKLD